MADNVGMGINDSGPNGTSIRTASEKGVDLVKQFQEKPGLQELAYKKVEDEIDAEARERRSREHMTAGLDVQEEDLEEMDQKMYSYIRKSLDTAASPQTGDSAEALRKSERVAEADNTAHGSKNHKREAKPNVRWKVPPATPDKNTVLGPRALRQPQPTGASRTTEIPTVVPLCIDPGTYLELTHLGKDGAASLPYKHVRVLGNGGSATVDMVKDTNTGKCYARKTFRNIYAYNMQQAKVSMHNEVRIMQRLASHHHFVKLHATIVMRRNFILLLEPVATKGDLAEFLHDYRDERDSHQDVSASKSFLEKSFGCLALGLEFMHRQTVRHKDIKPQNILVHNGEFGLTLLYTDFGISLDFGDAGQGTTTGLVQGMTARYCAPEVFQSGKRNTKSDVFSLGCVYLEIATTLQPDSISPALLQGPFHQTIADFTKTRLYRSALGSTIQAMTRADLGTRYAAHEVVFVLVQSNEAVCDRCIGEMDVDVNHTLNFFRFDELER